VEGAETEHEIVLCYRVAEAVAVVAVVLGTGSAAAVALVVAAVVISHYLHLSNPTNYQR
jgi:hypothetical protein